MAVAGSLVVELSANVARLSRDMRQANSVVAGTAQQMQRSLAGVGMAFRGLGAIGLVAGLQQVGSAIVDAGIHAQKLDNAFKAISGAGAAKELQFIKDESRRLGAEFLSTADAYKSLSAAARGTALQGEETRKIFTAVSEASTVLGLSADQAQGALYAIGQMMSKGKVQAEELRGQLGERLPGAFQIAARAMGMTTAELDKFMADGKLLAEDFLPRFAKQLSAEYSGGVAAAAQSAQAELNRLSNAGAELKESLAAGLLPILTDVVKGLTAVIKTAKEGSEAVKALEGVHQVGIEVQITTNAAQAQAEIQSVLRENGIGKSGFAQQMNRVFQWAGAASQKGAAGWFTTPFPGPSLTAGDRHSQGKNLRIGLGQTGAEQTHLEIVKGAAKAQREFNSAVADAMKWAAGHKTKLAELTEEQGKLNLLLKAGKGDTEEYKQAAAKLKEEWDALYKVGRGGGGGRSGGGINEMMQEAKRIWADTRTETERYAEELERLHKVYASGYLDLDTYTRAQAKLASEMNKGAMAAARTQADAIVAMRESISGTPQLGDAGIKYGGVANAMAENRYIEHLETLKEMGRQWDWLKSASMDFAMSAADAIAQFATSGKASFKDFANSIIQDLARMATRMAVMQIFGSILGAVGGAFGGSSGGASYSSMSSGFNVGFRAAGGPVAAMQPYIVGERGPELFVPKTAGYVHPGGAMGGTSVNTSITVNARLQSTGNEKEDLKRADLMGQQISRVVREEFLKNLAREQRAGGLLNRGVSI